MTYTTAELIQAELRATVPFSTTTFPTLAQLTVWITENDSHIDKIAGRTYASTQYVETLDYTNEDTIYLENSPIISIDTFNYATIALGATGYPTYAVKTEDTDFTTYNDRGEVEILSSNFSPSAGKKRFQITYTAGYTTPPAYVQMLATKMAAKRVIDSTLQKDTNEKQSGKSIGVGSINIVKPSDFGVASYDNLQKDIGSLKMELVKGKLNYRYQ